MACGRRGAAAEARKGHLAQPDRGDEPACEGEERDAGDEERDADRRTHHRQDERTRDDRQDHRDHETGGQRLPGLGGHQGTGPPRLACPEAGNQQCDGVDEDDGANAKEDRDGRQGHGDERRVRLHVADPGQPGTRFRVDAAPDLGDGPAHHGARVSVHGAVRHEDPADRRGLKGRRPVNDHEAVNRAPDHRVAAEDHEGVRVLALGEHDILPDRHDEAVNRAGLTSAPRVAGSRRERRRRKCEEHDHRAERGPDEPVHGAWASTP